MYRILAILAALSIALCFCLPVAAASYQDDCTDVLNDHIREYNGFSRNISDFIVFSGWSGCGDRSVITVDSREASYHFNNHFFVIHTQPHFISPFVKASIHLRCLKLSIIPSFIIIKYLSQSSSLKVEA